MKLTLICLHTTRHSDTRSILTVYSREAGRLAIGVAAGSGRGPARLRALTMPMAMLTCDTPEPRGGNEILSMRQASPLCITPALHSHPVKQMMAMFMAEVTDRVVRQGSADAAMFDFIAATALRLDRAGERELANFGICFLVKLAEAAGIEPDLSTYKKGRVFDMRDGVWRATPPVHADYLEPGEAAVAAMLMRMTFDSSARLRLDTAGRRQAIDTALRYFSIHAAPMGGLRSLAVLRSMV